ncbi:MAG: hypothetical protein JWP12_3456 [Bacteroidetes bacterium]|nr:hypothetical protein [Bacteroidota bacterium]
MRLFSFAFLGTLLICSCSAPNNGGQQIAAKDSIVNTTGGILLPGLWVNKKYVDAISKDRSPIDAQFIADRSCIYIPEKTGDTTWFVYGFYDGAEGLVLTKNANDYYLKSATKSATGYSQNLKIEMPDTNKIKIDTNIFIFAGKQDQQNDYKILEKFLFKGKYMMGNKTVEFKENGDLIGFPMLNSYKPKIDYSDYEGVPHFNTIDFLNDKQFVLKMGFKFINDSLILYKTTCTDFDTTDKVCIDLKLGEMLYQLKKVD